MISNHSFKMINNRPLVQANHSLIIEMQHLQMNSSSSTNILDKFLEIGQKFSKSLASKTTSQILTDIPYLNSIAQLNPYNNKLIRLTCMVRDCLPSGAFSPGCRDAQTNSKLQFIKYQVKILIELHVEVYINPLKSCPVPSDIFNQSKDPWGRFLPLQQLMMTIDRHLACSPPSLSKWAMNLFSGVVKPQEYQNTQQDRKFCLLHCVEFFKKEDNIQFPINQVFEVYGVLQVRSQDQEEDVSEQGKLQQLKAQKYSIMVLKVDRHDSQFSKQLMRQAYLSLVSEQKLGFLDSSQFHVNTANKLKAIFTELLGGDNISAEFILFNLVSNYYQKVENILFDNLPINLIGGSLTTLNTCQDDNKITTAEMLIRFISLIKQYCMPIPLSLDFLNKHPAVPVKNLESDQLQEGFLQQCNGSQLIINQTLMTQGKINEQGMKSIYALRDAYTSQVVMYDFKYSQIEFKTNFNYLILSEVKSLISKQQLKEVRLLEENKTASSSCNLNKLQELKQEDFWIFRNYFREMRLNTSGITFSNEIDHFATEEYVRMRKQAAQNEGQLALEQVNLIFLSNWLTASRLKVKSEGRNEVTKEDLEYVLVLEKELAKREAISKANIAKN